MKVAVSAKGDDETANVDERFGRCPYFVIVDKDEMEYESIENKHTQKSHGVAPQVVQMLSEMDVEAVITGNVGPNGYRTLESADIKVYKGSGKISDVVEKLKEGELEEIENETVRGHHGKGGKR
ncbi:MAG: NifB/NifX family molybdenum-iron cluster-binding protein [Candidatus Thermoplasmatota archaeon]|nr:NifB/NifX family molybdenum-iron cluster-binding protein [Candidatus Thermoplasmatota archaeon]MBS3789412.1 NifB/NifX family molybdenum-iron cluster-binding protein [Candidatus Thermoplasmatota archaeon]